MLAVKKEVSNCLKKINSISAKSAHQVNELSPDSQQELEWKKEAFWSESTTSVMGLGTKGPCGALGALLLKAGTGGSLWHTRSYHPAAHSWRGDIGKAAPLFRYQVQTQPRTSEGAFIFLYHIDLTDLWRPGDRTNYIAGAKSGCLI